MQCLAGPDFFSGKQLKPNSQEVFGMFGIKDIVVTPDHIQFSSVTSNNPVNWVGVDNILVTHSFVIPEPATAMLLGLGGLSLLRRRRTA
jgi:hypothetical protein